MREGRGQGRQFFIDGRDFLFDLSALRRAGTLEATIGQFDQTQILLVQVQRRCCVADRLNPFEEGGVEIDIIVDRGHFRPDFGRQALQRGIGIGAGHIREDGSNFGQRGTRFIKRNNGVFEGRGIRIAGNRLNLEFKFGDRDIAGRHVVGVLDLGKGRHAIRRVPILQQRIIGQHRFINIRTFGRRGSRLRRGIRAWGTHNITAGKNNCERCRAPKEVIFCSH